jgi:hypothetical protein
MSTILLKLARMMAGASMDELMAVYPRQNKGVRHCPTP